MHPHFLNSRILLYTDGYRAERKKTYIRLFYRHNYRRQNRLTANKKTGTAPGGTVPAKFVQSNQPFTDFSSASAS
jgi:hypothetical protein